MGTSKRKVLIFASVIAVCAAVGAVVGVVIWQTSHTKSGASKSNEAAGANANAKHQDAQSAGSKSISFANGNGSSSGALLKSAKTPTSDPAKATFSLSAYAIGDWGTTIGRDSCCKRRGDHTPTHIDENAEDLVAAVMTEAAKKADPKPKAVLSHGDNFYWVGIVDEADQKKRFQSTFEDKFGDSVIKDIPWVNVLGNHDYGGSSYICASGGQPAACANKEELLKGLDAKFSLQANYKSANNNRWVLTDHFYVYHLKDAASGVSIDIFNMDMNDADTHGAQQICCQCYGYSNGNDKGCEAAAPGDKYCMGGDMDMYKACYDKFKQWGDDSRKQLKEAVEASNATWKIVNSHYSPYVHYAANRQDMWWDLFKDLPVQLFIYGHTHGEKHDFAKVNNMHFIENGAGGGIINEAASGIPPYAADKVDKVWSYGKEDYGFFDLYASPEWLRVRFLTYDDKWSVQDSFSASTRGGVAIKHCWYIPVDGSLGKSCDADA